VATPSLHVAWRTMTSGTGGAPQDPAAPSLEEVSEGLSALRMAWAGEGLEFGCDRELRCWWAARGGPGGLLLKAGSPQELGALLAEQEGTGR